MSFMDYMCTRDASIKSNFQLPERKRERTVPHKTIVAIEPKEGENTLSDEERLWYWEQILNEARKVHALAQRKGIEIVFTRPPFRNQRSEGEREKK